MAGITSLIGKQVPPDTRGKGDFEFFYAGPLQTGDDRRIPAKAKRQDVYVDQLGGVVRTANTGRDILLDFYKGVTLLGTVTITAGSPNDTEFTTNIGETLISAGTMVTMVIRQIGSAVVGVTVSGWVRVSR